MPRKGEKKNFRDAVSLCQGKDFPPFCMQSSTVFLAYLFLLLALVIFLVAQVLTTLPFFLHTKGKFSICSSDASKLLMCPFSDPFVQRDRRESETEMHACCLAWGQFCIPFAKYKQSDFTSYSAFSFLKMCRPQVNIFWQTLSSLDRH